MKIMDSKELMNDIGFKLQSSVGLSIVQVPVVYIFKSTTSIFFQSSTDKILQKLQTSRITEIILYLNFSGTLSYGCFIYKCSFPFSIEFLFTWGAQRRSSSFILVFPFNYILGFSTCNAVFFKWVFEENETLTNLL